MSSPTSTSKIRIFVGNCLSSLRKFALQKKKKPKEAKVGEKTATMTSDIKTYTITEPWLKTNCGLGEGPYFDADTRTLRFIDIVKKDIFTVNVDKGPESLKKEATLDISIGVTATIDGEKDRFVFAGKEGYGIFDLNTKSYEYIKKYWSEDEVKDEKPHRMRGNDGNVDSRGRFWGGTMNDPLVKEPTDEGVLFRLDPDMTLHRMMENVVIPNGITWSPDDKIMYFTDSPSGRIDMFDFDAEKGTFSNQRPFFTMPKEDEGGVPDGHTWDEEGYMWIAGHGTSKVYRVNGEGKIVAVVKLPTASVTCPRFVDEDLVVTSAGGKDEEPDAMEGCVFKIHVGVKGRPPSHFKMNSKA